MIWICTLLGGVGTATIAVPVHSEKSRKGRRKTAADDRERDRHMSSATGFKGFLARLKDPSSVNLLSELNTTIEQFNDAPFAEGEEEKLVGAAGGGGDGGALGPWP